MATRKTKSANKTRDDGAIAPLADDSSRAVVKGGAHEIAAGGVHPVPLERIEPRPKRWLRRTALAALAFVAIAAAGRYGHDWLVRGQFVVSTDDAYVRSDLSIISPKVTGYAAAILVAENAHVEAGDILAEIEPGDYQLAVDAAQGKIATQDATIARIERQIDAQQAEVAKTQAQMNAAVADLERATSELERSKQLVARGVSSQKLHDDALAGHARARATLESALASVRSAQATVEVLTAQRQEAVSTRKEYETALRKAENDLADTRIRAPFAGVVGNLAVKQGQLVEPGTRLLALVPLDKVYVEANFKETQIERLEVGQRVDIAVDAFTGETVKGRIESISPAAGQEFSLLPPQNATGNFTKIVQRVPVRISIPAEIAAQGKLRPGLSVVARVNTLDPDAPRPTLLSLMGWAAADER